MNKAECINVRKRAERACNLQIDPERPSLHAWALEHTCWATWTGMYQSRSRNTDIGAVDHGTRVNLRGRGVVPMCADVHIT